jgi:hypothetical protein
MTTIQDITTSITAMTIAGPGSEPDWTHLPPELQDFRKLFDDSTANDLPPHRGQFDHKIRLKGTEDGRPVELPWGPMYGMSRDELVELRK